MPRDRDTVRADARAVLLDLLDRTLDDGDRSALDRLWPALPHHLATEVTALWHYRRAEIADRRRT